MAMKVSWIAQDKKKLKNDLTKLTDIAYMRCTFRKRLEEAGIKIEEDSQILVSEKNPFYTAKQKTVLDALEGKSLYLGHFTRKGEKLVLDRWMETTGKSFTQSENKDETRWFIRIEIKKMADINTDINTLKGEV